MGSSSLVMESPCQGAAGARVCSRCGAADTKGLAGTRIGEYQLNDVMGDGGTGMVYSGRHVVTDVQVAVKILHDHGARDLAERLEGGARAARAIHHANLVIVNDVGSMPDGTVFVVTESLQGETLQARLGRVARLPLDQYGRRPRSGPRS